jgi:Zn-dependent M28 family amino/carboxypeptidase
MTITETKSDGKVTVQQTTVQIIQEEEPPKDPIESYWNSSTLKQLVDHIDINRWYKFVEKLATFNRFALGLDIENATNWIIEELKKIPQMEVSKQEFTSRSKQMTNVIGKLQGDGEDIFVIGAHYDSISESPHNSAPGAIDNATGTAAVMELAHVFASQKPKNATLIFALFSGEEIGLLGSKAYVNSLGSLKKKVKFMLNLDMIGWDRGEGSSNMIEIETFPKYQDIAILFRSAALKFSSLPPMISLHAWGSDHIPFLSIDIPAVLTTNKDCIEYPCYHTTRDKVENVSSNVSLQIMKMDVATLSQFFYNNINLDTLIQK